MNERIQQLADKLWEEKYWTNPNTDKLLPAQLNRFAELIVRECINVVYRQERIPKEFFYPKPAHQHELAIKSHFGIE